jgi:AcrR family transcriptional regulator
MPVADLSLNELSRRVGLAKSNVLRYFESREAVLLELLDAAWQRWLQRLTADLDGPRQPERTPEDVAHIVTVSLVNDRPFCELVSVSAAILERNISVAVARRYKQSSLAHLATLAGLVARAVPALSPAGAAYFAAGTMVSITGIWPVAHPSDAMLCVYEDPAMASLRFDLATAMQEMLATLLAGCVVRWPADVDPA